MFAGSASLPAFVNAGVRAMQSTPLFDRAGGFLGILSTHYRSAHRFDDAERRWLDLLARPAGDAIHRRQTDARVTLATGRLEQRVADRTKWLALMHQVTRAINDADSWRDGLRLTVQRLCESEGWQAGYVYLPDRADPDTLVPAVGYLRDQRLQAFHRATQQGRFTRGDDAAGRGLRRRARAVGEHEGGRAAAAPRSSRRGGPGGAADRGRTAHPFRFRRDWRPGADLERAACTKHAAGRPDERHRRADRQGPRTRPVRHGDGRSGLAGAAGASAYPARLAGADADRPGHAGDRPRAAASGGDRRASDPDRTARPTGDHAGASARPRAVSTGDRCPQSDAGAARAGLDDEDVSRDSCRRGEWRQRADR